MIKLFIQWTIQDESVKWGSGGKSFAIGKEWWFNQWSFAIE